MTNNLRVPDPDLQISFAEALEEIRDLMLQEALLLTVADLPIKEIDKELNELVPQDALRTLASYGLRGELLFPVPCVLRANPVLLGYYRLVLGFSRKAFYTSENDLSRFKKMEDESRITRGNEESIEDLCAGLIDAACSLLSGLEGHDVDRRLLHELSLLTYGAQLRGGANVQRGLIGIRDVFEVIEGIVGTHADDVKPQTIRLTNAAGRAVLVEFASDPDIIIREAMSADDFRNIIAIEVKAGEDYSNIHNRLGEAEKSHQKARNRGYVECWTVYNVEGLDLDTAKTESPSTDRFYKLDHLVGGQGEDFSDFRRRIISLTGIPTSNEH